MKTKHMESALCFNKMLSRCVINAIDEEMENWKNTKKKMTTSVDGKEKDNKSESS